MAAPNPAECKVIYLADRIVLKGESEAIHEEARKLLKRFVYSTSPLHVVTDSEHEVVLSAAAQGTGHA